MKVCLMLNYERWTLSLCETTFFLPPTTNTNMR